MKKDLEPYPIELDVIQAEKLLKEPMRKFDLGKSDLAENFFEQMHDRIMAQIEQTEIQPKADEHHKALPKIWRFWKAKSNSKLNSPLLLLALLLLTGVAISNSLSGKKKATYEDQFLKEALNSPEDFESLVVGSLGQSDFLVDVASRNFDHLNLHEFDEIFGVPDVGLSVTPRTSQETR